MTKEIEKNIYHRPIYTMKTLPRLLGKSYAMINELGDLSKKGPQTAYAHMLFLFFLMS